MGKMNLDNLYDNPNIPLAYIKKILKSQGDSDSSIAKIIAKEHESRKKSYAIVEKFLRKLESRIKYLDETDRYIQAMKYARDKHMTKFEVELIRKYIMTGRFEVSKEQADILPAESGTVYDLSGWIGLDKGTDAVHTSITVASSDLTNLNDLVTLYDETLTLHNDIKTQTLMYTPFSTQVLYSEYNKENDIIHSAIHPLFIALFFPKIECLDNKMLFANIGRMVLQRTQQYLDDHLDTALNAPSSIGELVADHDILYDITTDQNVEHFFKNDSPMSHFLKRFEIQVEVWKTALRIRQGNVFNSRLADYDETNSSTLISKLNSYAWSIYDSPEVYNVNDEGKILRKLLNAFSFRPIYARIHTFGKKSDTQQFDIANLVGSNVESQTIRMPVLTVRLPSDKSMQNLKQLSLNAVIDDSDWFYENKMLVNKQRIVVDCKSLLIFHILRRHSSIVNIQDPNNVQDTPVNLRYFKLPVEFLRNNVVNEKEVQCNETVLLKNGRTFSIKSAVAAMYINNASISATGSVALFAIPEISTKNQNKSIRSPSGYYQYNPFMVGMTKSHDAAARGVGPDGTYKRVAEEELIGTRMVGKAVQQPYRVNYITQPFQIIDQNTKTEKNVPTNVGYIDELTKHATIVIYEDEETAKCELTDPALQLSERGTDNVLNI